MSVTAGLIVGILFSALGLTFAVKAIRFRRKAVKTIGVIVESKSQREIWTKQANKEGRKVLMELPAPESDESERWTITVEFTDTTGFKKRGNVEVSKVADQQVYQVGDPQPILYDPDRPWEIQTTMSLNWFGPLVVGMLGMIFVAISIVLWITSTS
jgi:hypothetical protein